MKTCVRCGEDKELTQFHNRKDSKDGKQNTCKLCAIAKARAWQKENPERFEASWRSRDQSPARKRQRFAARARQYGLTVDELTELIEGSGGVCNICQKPPTRWLVVDHCHNSLKVRGMLCEQCNQALGLFLDNTEVMKRAIEYLQKDN